MKAKKTFFFAIILIICSESAVFSQQILNPLEPIDLKEEWVNNRPINGEKRVGILSYTELKSINPDYLTVLIPKTDYNFLCLSIVSLDGRYSAKLNYDISEEKSGLVKLHFPTKHKSKLKKYSPEEITILASIGSECEESPNLFVLTTWDKDVSSEFFIVYINSRDQSSIIAIKENDIVFDKDFKKINSKNHLKVSYNQYCKIPVKYIDPNIELFVRERNRNSINDIELTIKK